MPAYIPPFSWIYISPADEVYIHWQLQYIFNCRCSIYSFFGYTILYGLFCLPGVRGDEVLAAVDDAGKLGAFPPVELFFILYSGAVSSGFSHCRKSRMFGSSR